MIFRTFRHQNTVIDISLDRGDNYRLTVNGVCRATNRSAEPLVLLAEKLIQDLEWEAWMDEQDALYNEGVQASYAARDRANLY